MQRFKFWIGASSLVVLGVIIGHLGANYDVYWPGNKALARRKNKTTPIDVFFGIIPAVEPLHAAPG